MTKNVKLYSFIGAAIVLVIIIAVLLIRGVSVEKKDDAGSATPTAVEESKTPIDAPTKSEEPVEAPPSGEATEPSDAGGSTDDPTESPDEGTAEETKSPEEDGSDNFEPSKVKEPKLEGKFKAGGFVLDKYVINDNKQYQYVIEIRLTNDSGSKNIKYYATKKAYDGLNEGDVLTVTYAGDKNGNLAVETISR